MACTVILPEDFDEHLPIANAPERFEEARDVAARIGEAGVDLMSNPDHAAIFVDPPHLVAGPLQHLGYTAGWDARCYPSPVDGCDYINVSSRLSDDCPARERSWFDYVAVVYPVDTRARQQMLRQGYGNPFIHHLTFGVKPPSRASGDLVAYAGQIVRHMVQTRARIQETVGQELGTLIMALPQDVLDQARFAEALPGWMSGLAQDQYLVEPMQGGGFLIQFFVLTGGRIEVALRLDTQQTFNPRSVQKISKDEISTAQSPAGHPVRQ